MKENEILTLIEKAREFANHSFVPHTGIAVGACALTEDKIIYGGATIENNSPSASVAAPSVAVLKAVSEGHVDIMAVAVFKDGEQSLPYLTGVDREIIYQFGKNAFIIMANDEKYETCRIYELIPFGDKGE